MAETPPPTSTLTPNILVIVFSDMYTYYVYEEKLFGCCVQFAWQVVVGVNIFISLQVLVLAPYTYIILFVCLLFSWRYNPLWLYFHSPVTGFSLLVFARFLDHTQRRATVGRTPQDEWSIRRRDLYRTTHPTHNRQTSMSLLGFEPTMSACLADEDLRLRPRGHWDCQISYSWNTIIKTSHVSVKHITETCDCIIVFQFQNTTGCPLKNTKIWWLCYKDIWYRFRKYICQHKQSVAKRGLHSWEGIAIASTGYKNCLSYLILLLIDAVGRFSSVCITLFCWLIWRTERMLIMCFVVKLVWI
jgi:hypothetical protein